MKKSQWYEQTKNCNTEARHIVNLSEIRLKYINEIN